MIPGRKDRKEFIAVISRSEFLRSFFMHRNYLLEMFILLSTEDGKKQENVR